MTRSERQINWDLRDPLCDRRLCRVEQDEDTPISELCDRCQRKLVKWTLGTPVTEEMRRTAEQVTGRAIDVPKADQLPRESRRGRQSKPVGVLLPRHFGVNSETFKSIS